MKESLKEIVRKCKPCQNFNPRSTRYRVALSIDEILFNHEIEVDVTWIESEPILRIMDRGTRYSVCKYITCSQTAENLWYKILEFWINVFTGFSNIISADRQSAFRSKFFKETCNQLGIHSKITSTEWHNSLSIPERYHPIIRCVFNRIRTDYPKMNKKNSTIHIN